VLCSRSTLARQARPFPRAPFSATVTPWRHAYYSVGSAQAWDEEEARMIRMALAALLTGFALAPCALAQNAPAESEDSRYKFERVQEGFVRLDARTGQVALCSRHAVGWACEGMAEKPGALESEIARLQGENDALKKELLAHGLNLPSGIKPTPSTAQVGDHELKLPSDAELDRVMAFMEMAWRRLVDMMINLQRDVRKKS
jgi:hypothetical protein